MYPSLNPLPPPCPISFLSPLVWNLLSSFSAWGMFTDLAHLTVHKSCASDLKWVLRAVAMPYSEGRTSQHSSPTSGLFHSPATPFPMMFKVVQLVFSSLGYNVSTVFLFSFPSLSFFSFFFLFFLPVFILRQGLYAFWGRASLRCPGMCWNSHRSACLYFPQSWD